MPFDDKRLTTLDPLTIGGFEMKRYHIDQSAQPLSPDVVAAAYAALEPLLPAVDDSTPPAGWIVVHRGAGTGAYALDRFAESVVGR